MRNKRIAALGFASVTVLGAGIAGAAFNWTAQGSGDGAATARTMTVTVVAATPPAADLYPGASGDLAVSVKNENPFNFTIESISTGTPVLPSGCTLVTFDTSVLTLAAGSDGLAVTAGETNDLVLDDVVTMDDDAENACQGAAITVPVTVTARQSA